MTDFVLLDRDGVLNEDLPGSVTCVEELRMLPGAASAVAQLGAKGYAVLVVTNQACVGRGQLTTEALSLIHARVEAEVAAAGGRIAGWYVCTHRAEDACSCRKPAPGLILQAREEHAFELTRTCFVGDAARDVAAARAAGCQPILVETGKGAHTLLEYPDVPSYVDLMAFAQAVLPSTGHSP